jgi:hypothetical protein
MRNGNHRVLYTILDSRSSRNRKPFRLTVQDPHGTLHAVALIIEIKNLVKTCHSFCAVNDVSLAIEEIK